MHASTNQRQLPTPPTALPPDQTALARLRAQGACEEDILNAVFAHATRGEYEAAFGLFFALEAGSRRASWKYAKPYAGLVGRYRASLRTQEEDVLAHALLDEHDLARQKLALLEAESGLRFPRTRALLRERRAASERRRAEERALLPNPLLPCSSPGALPRLG